MNKHFYRVEAAENISGFIADVLHSSEVSI